MNNSQTRTFAKIFSAHVGVGAFLGVLFLHPVTMAIYWFEFHPQLPNSPTIWAFIAHRLRSSFTLEMLPMTSMFIGVGGVLGIGSAIYYLALKKSKGLISVFEGQLGADIEGIIQSGESEMVEFKAASRWDNKNGRVEKKLEMNIAKAIAAFLNHRGGNLLIGVTDSGEIVGLDHDYKTLKKNSRDGFELFIMTLVKNKLDASASPFVHVIFHSLNDLDVCRIIIEPSSHPIYVQEKGISQYYLRSGNSSRELDVEQAMKHIKARWPI